jgi:hypothetical protein
VRRLASAIVLHMAPLCCPACCQLLGCLLTWRQPRNAANVCQGSPTNGQAGFDYSSCSDSAGQDVSGAACVPTCAAGYTAGAGAAGTATGFTMSCDGSGVYTIPSNDASLTCTRAVSRVQVWKCSDRHLIYALFALRSKPVYGFADERGTDRV